MSIRYVLRDRGALRWVMEHPGRGAPYSVRTLAAESGLSSATVGHLISGRLATLEMADAHALAEALGVAVLVLFAPPASPNQNVADPEPDHRAEGKFECVLARSHPQE